MRHQYQANNTKNIATLDIPLDTGVAGVGVPQIRSGSSPPTSTSTMITNSYYLQPEFSVGLCVQTSGDEVLNYLMEFVQHHANLGFGSIVIGIRGQEKE